MKRQLYLAGAICLLAQSTLAQTRTCSGVDPEWTMTITPDGARFAYLDRESDMQIPQSTQPKGAEWPRAMTLVGLRDSAIVILESLEGSQQPIRVLTQRGEEPVMLVGTCLVTQ